MCLFVLLICLFLFRYCDRACKVEECGFDAGDCGLDLMTQLFHANVDENTHQIEVMWWCDVVGMCCVVLYVVLCYD